MKILLPISLDRWRNPISTLLRACVIHNPEIEFHSFSNPLSDEDRAEGAQFWKLPNIKARHPAAILSERFDIVHTASYSHGNYAASVISKLRGAKHTKILDTMNLEPHPSFPVCWRRYRRVLRWVDGFVAVSEAVASDIRQRVPERFLGVIPNGFDSKFYDSNADYTVDFPEELRDVPSGYPTWVASLEARKHPEIFVKLAKANPEIPFVAIGGAYNEEQRAFGRDFETTPNIHWLKEVDRKTGRAILSRAGVLIFPSEREGLSLAMIEAVSMGLPIIAQPKSSMPEIVSSGLNGELVEENDFAGWNHAIHKWRTSRSQAQQESLNAARLDALTRFEWSKVGRAYGPVYQQLLEFPRKILQLAPTDIKNINIVIS